MKLTLVTTSGFRFTHQDPLEGTETGEEGASRVNNGAYYRERIAPMLNAKATGIIPQPTNAMDSFCTKIPKVIIAKTDNHMRTKVNLIFIVTPQVLRQLLPSKIVVTHSSIIPKNGISIITQFSGWNKESEYFDAVR